MQEKITYHKMDLSDTSGEEDEKKSQPEEDKIFYKIIRENYYNGGLNERKYPFNIYKDYNFGIVFKTSYKIGEDRLKDRIDHYIDENKEKIITSHRAYPGKNLKRENNFFNTSYIEYLGEKYALDLKVDTNIKYNELQWSNHRVYIKYNEEELENIKNGYKKEDQIIDMIIDDYYEKAKRYINKKVDKFSQIMNVDPNRIIVKKHMRSKPSDCTEKGNITFAWNVLRFPEKIIDALIIHELAHLAQGEYQSHDDQFYEITSMYVSDQFQKSNLIDRMSQNMFFINEKYFIKTAI